MICQMVMQLDLPMGLELTSSTFEFFGNRFFSYFRFHRTPSFESSSTIPFPASSLRIASALAKFLFLGPHKSRRNAESTNS